jgi:hypothetical protein
VSVYYVNRVRRNVIARPEIEFGQRDTFADKEEPVPRAAAVIPTIDSVCSRRRIFSTFFRIQIN